MQYLPLENETVLENESPKSSGKWEKWKKLEKGSKIDVYDLDGTITYRNGPLSGWNCWTRAVFEQAITFPKTPFRARIIAGLFYPLIVYKVIKSPDSSHPKPRDLYLLNIGFKGFHKDLLNVSSKKLKLNKYVVDCIKNRKKKGNKVCVVTGSPKDAVVYLLNDAGIKVDFVKGLEMKYNKNNKAVGLDFSDRYTSIMSAKKGNVHAAKNYVFSRILNNEYTSKISSIGNSMNGNGDGYGSDEISQNFVEKNLIKYFGWLPEDASDYLNSIKIGNYHTPVKGKCGYIQSE